MPGRFSICRLRQMDLPRFQMKKPPNFVGGLLKIFVNRIGQISNHFINDLKVVADLSFEI
jgi:hypothetical protein